MQNKENLLKLHYIWQQPIQRFLPLLQQDPHFSSLTQTSKTTLQKLLNISEKKAFELQGKWKEIQGVSMQQFYDKQSIVTVSYFDDIYPSHLRTIYDPPAVLYVKGNVDILKNARKIAVVGTRQATDYSKRCMQKFIPVLTAHNYVVVSGLARGADTMAHLETIRQQGQTIAVLGHGFHYQYPEENGLLRKEMEKMHVVMSEYPPYVAPKKWQFPMRNRIIAGLAYGVVVTEATENSGTLSTLDYALENGREVFVVPGNIYSKFSLGPHKLLLEGATPIWNANQIIGQIEQILPIDDKKSCKS